MYSFSKISKKYIKEKLKDTPYNIEVKNTVTSTNTIMKERVSKEDRGFSVLIASKQTAGRGRMGRNFYSPSKSGVYMSVALEIDEGKNPLRITTDAAVCAARVLERLSSKKAYIKWVNDIYIDGKKVCGILTEGVGKYAILGIGINVLPPKYNFPEDIKERAGAVFEKKMPHIRETVIADFLIEFMRVYNEDRNFLLEEYRSRSMIIGKEITILQNNKNEKATALAIADDYSLVVRKEDGETVNLSSGDVSIKI